MTSMKDREEGFERKFAMDEELRFKAGARRNKQLGLWVAGKLGKSGRILVRKSGTEPLIRVMAEGDDSDLVRSVVDGIIEAIPRQAA